jgi:hypothetical protein
MLTLSKKGLFVLTFESEKEKNSYGMIWEHNFPLKMSYRYKKLKTEKNVVGLRRQ